MQDSSITSSSSSTLHLILHLLPLLLLPSLSTKSFSSRWHSIRSKLSTLQSSLSLISPPSSSSLQNPLLLHLLPNLLSTLQKLQSLALLCSPSSCPSPGVGKLHLQSDLDSASSSLTLHIHDLDLLLKSGVLSRPSSSLDAAIVLSHPTPSASKEDLAFFVRDVFARLQIGGLEFKKKALESLIQLLHDDEKNAVVVSEEGDIGYLIHILDAGGYPSYIREQAVSAVAVLAESADSARRALFEEGGLGPLLRLIETGSSAVKEKAAVAVEALTADPENAWAVSAYSGVPTLIEACRSGSSVTRVHVSGVLKNVVAVEDLQRAMVEEGAIPVLVELLGVDGLAQGHAAKCLSILASCGEDFRVLIAEEDGVKRFLKLVEEPPNFETLEHALRAIHALSGSPAIARALSSSIGFLTQLAELIKQGNPNVQQISASLICNLSLTDSSKRAISGCMSQLVKMLELPKPVGLQEIGARALASLLAVRGNRKEFTRDEKSLTRLVLMLDPKKEAICKKFPMMVVSVLLVGGGGARKRLVAAGACQHLQVLADMDVPGAKKASQKLAGNRLKSIFSRTWRE